MISSSHRSRSCAHDATWQPPTIGGGKNHFSGVNLVLRTRSPQLGREIGCPSTPGAWHESSHEARPARRSMPHSRRARRRGKSCIELPGLALRAVTVGRRVEDHGIVASGRRLISRATNSRASSTIQRIGTAARPEARRVAARPRKLRCGPRRRELPRPLPPRPLACCRRCRRKGSNTLIGGSALASAPHAGNGQSNSSWASAPGKSPTWAGVGRAQLSAIGSDRNRPRQRIADNPTSCASRVSALVARGSRRATAPATAARPVRPPATVDRWSRCRSARAFARGRSRAVLNLTEIVMRLTGYRVQATGSSRRR